LIEQQWHLLLVLVKKMVKLLWHFIMGHIWENFCVWVKSCQWRDTWKASRPVARSQRTGFRCDFLL